MDTLKQKFSENIIKFKGLRKGVKIAIGISVVTIVVALIGFTTYFSSNKYQVLFNNLDAKDAQVITAKLKEEKIETKVQGNKILVPKDKVDELRLQLAPNISNGSHGYELMDEKNSFGMTDEEFKIEKVRMLQGELERTIKSFPQVQSSKVLITPSKDSVFIKEDKPAKASVYLQLKDGETLKDDQVRAIVSLVSASAENLPKKNIEVVDQNLKLLSRGLFEDADGSNGMGASSSSVTKQQDLEKNYNESLEKSVMKLLEPVVGEGKAKVIVNASLDFNSNQKTQTIIDPNKVIESQHTLKDIVNGSGDSSTVSESPVDNNMSNNIVDKDNKGKTQNVKEEQTTKYNSGKTEIKTISAPGEVKRLTASVVLDGTIDQNTQDAIKNLVANAIGFKQDRGDEITVAAMNFDNTAKTDAKKQFEKMKKDEENSKKVALYKEIGFGALGAIVILGIVIFLIKRRRQREDEQSIDMLINDNSIYSQESQKFEPINFEVKNEKTHVESEIKKYAEEKPEQVADVVKSWLSENER